MRLPSFTHKKISPFLALLLVALVVFGMGVPHAAQAITLVNVAELAANVAAHIAQAAAWIVQRILILILFIESFIIDNLFTFNIVLNPTNMPAVIGAWTVLRDIANSLFLLILLWLAIQIIWGLDNGSSKKLLVRLIIVAFLINFSLAITGVLFGFGNALAKPFKDKMGYDVGAYIVKVTKLNTVMNMPANPQKIPAQSKCILSALTTSAIPVECPEKAGGVEAMNMISGAGSALGAAVLNDKMKNAVGMWIANIFLILIILAFGGVGGFLIVRIVMMAFLGVLSPAAFFLYAVPGCEGLYKRWQRNVVGWAFIAPTFYFLFYVSLLVLRAMTESNITQISASIPFSANLFAMLPLVIFVVFLGATLSLCKKLGAEVADAAINMGKMAAGVALTGAAAVATGGASLLAGRAAGFGAGLAKKTVPAVLDKLEGRPILRTLARPVTGPIRSYYEKRNQGIDEKKEKIKSRSSTSLTEEFKKTLRPDQRVAIAETLRERADGSFDKLDKRSQDIYADSAKRLGRDAYLQARPDKATKDTVPGAKNDYEAKKGIFNKMKSGTKRLVSKFALEDDDTKKAFLETMTLSDLKDIMRHNAEMTHTLIFDFFTKNQEMMQKIMKQETLTFIYGSMRIQTANPSPAPAPATPPTQGTPPAGGTTPATPPPTPPPPTPPPTQPPTP